MWCSDVGKDGKYMKIWNIWKTNHGILVEKMPHASGVGNIFTRTPVVCWYGQF